MRFCDVERWTVTHFPAAFIYPHAVYRWYISPGMFASRTTAIHAWCSVATARRCNHGRTVHPAAFAVLLRGAIDPSNQLRPSSHSSQLLKLNDTKFHLSPPPGCQVYSFWLNHITTALYDETEEDIDWSLIAYERESVRVSSGHLVTMQIMPWKPPKKTKALSGIGINKASPAGFCRPTSFVLSIFAFPMPPLAPTPACGCS